MTNHMKKRSFILLPLALLGFAACQSLEPDQPGQEGKEITFSTSIGSFTKATDNSFEAGDIAGLSAGDPVDVSNVKLTYSEGSFTPERTIFWGLDQAGDKKTTFAAYYPYNASLDPMKAFDWTIPADQSAAGAYAGADLLTAKTEAAPNDGTVHLAFSHVLSRLALTVENKVEGEEIAGVKMNGVKLAASVDILGGSVTAKGDAQAVTPASAGNLLYFMVAPQTVSPEVLVTMKSGKVVRYTPKEDLVFASGKQILATIAVEKDAVNFTAQVVDWLDVEGHLGKEEDPGVQEHIWSVEYNESLYPFEEQEDGTYHQVFSVGSYWAQIRIIKDDYDEIWGCAIPNYGKYLTAKEPTDVVPMAPNYYFYIQGEGDIFDLVLDTKAKTLTITLLEHQWEPLGTGIFIDDIVSNAFTFPHEEIPVEVEADKNASIYRIKNPYKNWSYSKYFDYTDEAEIILYVKPDGSVWFRETFLGLSDSRYGDFYASTMVPETGWDYNYYGLYYPKYGFIQFTNYLNYNLTSYGSLRSNRNGMTSLTLPGFERPVHYYTFTHEYYDVLKEESGQGYMRVQAKTGMDVVKLKYGLYAGTLSDEEVFGKNKDGLCYTEVAVKGTEVEFDPDDEFLLAVPVPQSGTYTLVFCGENAEGNIVVANDGHYWVLFEGDEAPEPSSSVSATPAQLFSDVQLNANVTFTDPKTVYLTAVEDKIWQESGLTDDDIFDYTVSTGQRKSEYYFNSKTGGDFIIQSLKPQTAYRVFVAGYDQFGSSAWAQTTATTAASPEFTSMGKGHYTDKFLFYQQMTEEGYTSEVEILKAETTPVRYRVAYPYKAFWDVYKNKIPYNEKEAASIDFYLDGEKLIYNAFLTGYKIEDMGDLAYYSLNPNTDQHLANNCVIQEGVYNLAPYAKIEGTKYYYDLTRYMGGIYIEMPGYTYNPPKDDAAGIAVRSVRKSNLVEAPEMAGLMVQDQIRPFTRHMLNTGAPKVTRVQNQLSEITAEPIK